MFKKSTLPEKLPTETISIHKLGFTLPRTMSDADIDFMLQDLVPGLDWTAAKNKEFGGLFSFHRHYTLRNGLGEVLITVLTDGTGLAKNKTTVFINGRCFEMSSHNSLRDVTGELLITLPAVASVVDRHQGRFIRIDLYKDDFLGILPFDYLKELSHRDKFRDRVVTKLNKKSPPVIVSSTSDSIYFGSSKSKNQILIYDKGLQLATKWRWTRVELKIRDRRDCATIIDMLLLREWDHPGISYVEKLDAIVKGILCDYIQFKEAGFIDKSKRPTCHFWRAFVGDVPLKLPRQTTLKKDEP